MSSRQLSQDEIKTMLAQMQPADDEPPAASDAAAGAAQSPQPADAAAEKPTGGGAGPADSRDLPAEPPNETSEADPGERQREAAAEDRPQVPEASQELPSSQQPETPPPYEPDADAADGGSEADARDASGQRTGAAEENTATMPPAPPAESTVEDGGTDEPAAASPDSEPAPGARPRRRYLAAAAMAAVLLVAGIGLFLLRSGRPVPPPEPVAASPAPAAGTEAGTRAPSATIAPHASDPLDRKFTVQLEELTALREELLIRAGTLAEIQGDYRSAIDRVLDEILEEKRRNAVRGLPRALEIPALALRLATIQRRQAYIRCLDAPVAELEKSAEDLLFLKRKSEIQRLIVDACPDLSLSRLIEQNRQVLTEYRAIPRQLHVDLNSVRRRPMEEIWQAVVEREKQYALRSYPDSRESPRAASLEDDRQIWQELCSGRFSRKSQLGSLSAEAAACLARSDEPDLFLNRLAQLGPEAARRLVQWKGKWLCMNGLHELTPEVARTLFAWEGRWISLNGLEMLPFDASMYLSRWEGHTLELMGLSARKMKQDPLALRHLRLWEAEGGKLFVADEVRRLMENLS